MGKYFEGAINSDKMITIEKVKSTAGVADDLESNYQGSKFHSGGMNATEGTIQITEQWFSNKWSGSGMQQPYYLYLTKGFGTYWNETRRGIPFEEMFAHEMIHAGRWAKGETSLNRWGTVNHLEEENATRSGVNNWRTIRGIPHRGILHAPSTLDYFIDPGINYKEKLYKKR